MSPLFFVIPFIWVVSISIVYYLLSRLDKLPLLRNRHEGNHNDRLHRQMRAMRLARLIYANNNRVRYIALKREFVCG